MTTQTQSQELALREATQSAVAQFQNDEFAAQIRAALPEGVLARQFLRIAANAVLENPDLTRPALRASLLKATLKAAEVGLAPNGIEAAFIVFKTKDKGEQVQFLPMIGGLRKVAADHGWSVLTAVVYENDVFEPDLDKHIAGHKPTPLGKDRGKPVGAYAIAEHRDGRRAGPEIFTMDDIARARAVSRAANGPGWTKWFDRMAEKTVGKRLVKKLALDPGDRRVAGLMSALNDDPDSAADQLYGPADGDDGKSEAPLPPVGASDSPQDADAPEQEPEDAVFTEGAPADDDFNEPSDEDLDAFGADDGDPALFTETEEEPRFDKGKFAGKTVAEVYEEGKRGVAYLHWALGAWSDGPLKDSLVAFAADHPEIS